MGFIHLPIHMDEMKKEGEKTAGQNAIIKSILNAVAPKHAHLVKLHENGSVPFKLSRSEY
jgi:hypothetical protein